MYRTNTLSPTTPARARLTVRDGLAIPVLSFVPFLDGSWDLYYDQGTPAEQAARLRQLAETASDLAIRVERHAAQVAAFESYEVSA